MTKRKVRINHDYFSLNTRWENMKFFLFKRNFIAHIVDRVKWHYCPKFFMTPSFPTHIDIEASSACQMRCPMCRTTDMVRKGLLKSAHMPMTLYKKIIDECANESLYSVKLNWRGEPLLSPDIVEMVSYAKKKGIKDVAFLTNGMRLDKKMIEGLVKAGLDWISISFDGMGKIYNEIRKPAIFEETLAKIKQLRQYREGLNRKKPLIRVQSIHTAIADKELEFLKLWEGVADRVNFIADQKRSNDEKDYKHDPSYICPSPWQRMVISWNGKVVGCCEDYLEGNVLGDANEKSLKEIWHDEAFHNLRGLMKNGRRLLTKPCRICSDGGFIENEEIVIGKRAIRSAHYVDQHIDVKEFASSSKEKS